MAKEPKFDPSRAQRMAQKVAHLSVGVGGPLLGPIMAAVAGAIGAVSKTDAEAEAAIARFLAEAKD